jgi:hypothetical protein
VGFFYAYTYLFHMKITRAELKSIINEVLSEVVDSDKFTKALDTLAKKQQILKVNSSKIGVDMAKVKLAQAQEKEKVASDNLDAAEARGEDATSETDAWNNSKENTQKARDGVSAANNNLKAAQKGGAPTSN